MGDEILNPCYLIYSSCSTFRSDTKEILHFRKSSPCPSFFSDLETVQEIKAKAQIKKLLGRDIDIIYGNHYVRNISIPSFTLNEIRRPAVPKGFSKKIWKDFSSSDTPDGILFFDKKDIISSAEPIPYDIFPGNIGVMQLLNQEVLIKLYGNSNHFKIVKPMKRFPGNLRGVFVLGKGIPFPEGSPGNATIISEETGEQLYPKQNKR